MSFYPLDPLFNLLVVNLLNVMKNPNKLVIGLPLFGMDESGRAKILQEAAG